MKDLMVAYEEARFGTALQKGAASLGVERLKTQAQQATSPEQVEQIQGWLSRLLGKARKVLGEEGTSAEARKSWQSVVAEAPEARKLLSERLAELLSGGGTESAGRAGARGSTASTIARGVKGAGRGAAATAARSFSPDYQLTDLWAAPQSERELLGGKTRLDVLEILERAMDKAKRPTPQAATPLLSGLSKARGGLKSLIRNAKVTRALKTLGPLGAGLGIPLVGYGALKGLDALLTSKKAADDTRSLTSRVADYFAMSKLTPQNRKLRDAIEQLIRNEKRLRAQALDEIHASRESLHAPASTGLIGLTSDIVRSAIPGLAPTAAVQDTGIEKPAVDLEMSEGPSGFGTLAHLLAGATGAGVGAGVQSGALGGLRRADILAEGLPANLSKVISDAIQGVGPEQAQAATKKLLQGMSGKQLAQLAGAEKPGILSGLSNLLTHRTVRDPQGRLLRRLRATVGGSPATSKRLSSRVIEQLGNALKGAQRSGVTPPGWKLGAGIGAAALTLPFVIGNLLRARSLRAQGGAPTRAAATRAAQLLARANALQEQRQQLLSQLS